jgi:hypothetical protein
MGCGFCNGELVDGWVSLRGVLPFGGGDVVLTWEPSEARTAKRRWRDVGRRGRRGQVALLSGTTLRRRERSGALCRDCGAVVLDPITPIPDTDQ